MVERFDTVEEIIRTNEQGEKVQGKDLSLPVLLRVRDDLPRVLTAYSIITPDKPSSSKYSKVSKNVDRNL